MAVSSARENQMLPPTAIGDGYVDKASEDAGDGSAFQAKAALGRLPVVAADGPGPAAYQALWEGAFAGGGTWPSLPGPASLGLHAAAKRRRSVHGAAEWSPGRRAALAAAVRLSHPGRPVDARHVVVKPVFAPFALEWSVAGLSRASLW